MEEHNRDDLTVFVGNMDNKVTEELLYELFLQAGPLKSVNIPAKKNCNNRQLKFGFVTFKHIVSVNFAIELLGGIKVFNSPLQLSQKLKKNQENNFRQDRNGHYSSSPNPNVNNVQLDHYHPNMKYATPMNSYTPEAVQPLQNFLHSGDHHNRYSAKYQNTSTPRELRQSQSFNLSERHPSVNFPTSQSSGRRNGSHNSPHHRNHSPSADLKRSRSHQFFSRHENRRHESRDHRDLGHGSSYHQQSTDSRRVVSRRRSSHAPYEKHPPYRR